MSQILVVEDKHYTSYYPASTTEELAKSSLVLLTMRFENGYTYLTPDEMYPDDSEWTVSIKQLIPNFPADDASKVEKAEAIRVWREANVDSIADKDARAVVAKKLNSAIKNYNEKFQYIKWYNELERIVAEQDLSTVTVGRNKYERQEPRAWRILEERSDYEYERVSLEKLEEV